MHTLNPTSTRRYLEIDSLHNLDLFKRAAKIIGCKVFKDSRVMIAHKEKVYGIHLTEEQLAMFLLVYPIDPESELWDQFYTFTYELGHPFIRPDITGAFVVSDFWQVIGNKLHFTQDNRCFLNDMEFA